MGKFDALYARLPLWMQHGAVSAYGLYWYWLRFGRGYSEYVRAYQDREEFSTEAWTEWQQHEIVRLLNRVATSVPYYKETWTPIEKAAARAGCLFDLPLLEKDAVRSRSTAFLQEDEHPWPQLTFHTSGSTGTPVATIWSVQELRESMALREARSAQWAGVSFQMPRATFSGRLVEPDPDSEGPFYRFNLTERQVYFSPFHLRPNTTHKYVEALNKHGIEWLTGYAISFYLLARFIKERGLRTPPLKAIITTSEKVTAEMRQTMESVYGCRVYEEYSTVENVIFAAECQHGRLHVSPDVSVVEILKPNGTPSKPGEVGEVVVTSLLRQYQPLIRYRLGDLASWDAEKCPCGRAMPIIKEVVGRVEDVVIGPDGRQMVRFHGIFTDQPHIREGQIVQERIDHIRVRVVPTPGFSPVDEIDIQVRVQQRLGSNVRVDVECVDNIPRTPSGKFQAVISHLDDRELANLGGSG